MSYTNLKYLDTTSLETFSTLLEELTAQARTAQRAVEHRHAITDARRRAQQMRRALETDPAVEAKHRRVMELWRRGLTHKEIATATGYSYGYVRNLVCKLRPR